MRLKVILPAALLCAAASIPSLPAQADSTFPSAGPCPSYGGVQICSGEVPSFDGSPLDVDVTLPARNTGDRHPLIVMLHGFGNNKHEWESLTNEGDNADKWHWNNHWFAEHGFYVLTYTARGFLDQGQTRGDEPNTPPGAPFGSYTGPGTNGTVHLKSRDFEIKDTQWLAALTAAAYPDLDTNQVAVTGGSYGGGESWMQASQPVWNANTLKPNTFGLPILQLQVAVPKYPWTDLGYSLAPNGHRGPFDSSIYSSSTGSPTSDTGDGNPLGVIKYSYATGFLAEGIAGGFFEGPLPEDIPAWYGRAVSPGGDPYDLGSPGTDTDNIVRELRRGLTELRGSYYQDEFWSQEFSNREVAIYSVSGWTDDLFPPVEAFREFKYLKSLDPLWPVELAVADIGHPRAQNPAWEWHHLNDQAWGFLKEQIHGSHRQQTNVSSLPTMCPGPASSSTETGPIQDLTGRTPEELANGSLTINYTSGDTLVNRKPPSFPAPDPLDPDNLQTDPAFGSALLHYPGCRASIAPTTLPAARYTAYSQALDRPRIYVGLGSVHVDYTLTDANTATLDARVWDVGPDGKAFLMTRGTYRIDGNGTPAGYDPIPKGSLDLPLFGNQWTLEAGHSIRLDLTQVDYPTFLPSNSTLASISFAGAQLVLPTREATNLIISGS
jgi:predicted acyl esterase